MKWNESFTTSRRRLLCIFGIGAAGAILAPSAVFAKQFAKDTTPVKLPNMVYDAELQVMVDPATGQQLYSRAEMLAVQDKNTHGTQKKGGGHKKLSKNKKFAHHNPTVTAGCKTCPKCDDYCEF